MSGRFRDLAALLIAVAVPLIAGGVGALFTASSLSDWYRDLNKPAWNLPNWVFGPVWTSLYILMGIAAWLIWRWRGDVPGVRFALGLFGVQLVFNLLWSVVFFGLRSPGLALVEILGLLALVLATTIQFARIRVVAGLLLLPYLLWTAFATVLNASIWQLNR